MVTISCLCTCIWVSQSQCVFVFYDASFSTELEDELNLFILYAWHWDCTLSNHYCACLYAKTLTFQFLMISPKELNFTSHAKSPLFCGVVSYLTKRLKSTGIVSTLLPLRNLFSFNCFMWMEIWPRDIFVRHFFMTYSEWEMELTLSALITESKVNYLCYDES